MVDGLHVLCIVCLLTRGHTLFEEENRGKRNRTTAFEGFFTAYLHPRGRLGCGRCCFACGFAGANSVASTRNYPCIRKAGGSDAQAFPREPGGSRSQDPEHPAQIRQPLERCRKGRSPQIGALRTRAVRKAAGLSFGELG